MPYTITRDFIWKEVGGDIVVLNLDSGRYFSLNGTGERDLDRAHGEERARPSR